MLDALPARVAHAAAVHIPLHSPCTPVTSSLPVHHTTQVRGLSRMGNGNRLWGARTDSFEVALNKGRVEVQQMVDHFHIR